MTDDQRAGEIRPSLLRLEAGFEGPLADEAELPFQMDRFRFEGLAGGEQSRPGHEQDSDGETPIKSAHETPLAMSETSIGPYEMNRGTTISSVERLGLDELLAHVPVADAAKADVLAMLAAPNRHYHGMGHVASLWGHHRRYAGDVGLSACPVERLIAAAILYHDCVYEPGHADNEARSAEVWLDASRDGPLDEAERAWVADTIRATRDHFGYGRHIEATDDVEAHLERARLWLLDLDLASLGATPAVFDRNTALLRREMASQTEAEWKAGQRVFVRRCLDAPRIYKTPRLAALFEDTARRNLHRFLAML